MFFQGNEKYNCATYLRLSRSDGDQQESNSQYYVDDGYSGTNFDEVR